MENESRQPVDGLSDHQKFGEGSDLHDAAAQAKAGVNETVSEVYDRIEETERTVRERAVQLKAQLADKLESGASVLRDKTTNTAKIDDAITNAKANVADASERVATGMEKSADWLRETDLSTVQKGLETRVRANPGKTLLAAIGLGFLIGRAFRGKRD